VVDVCLVDGKVAGVPRPLVTAYQKTKSHVIDDGNLHGAQCIYIDIQAIIVVNVMIMGSL